MIPRKYDSIILIVFITSFTYLPLTPFLGFYADDWFQNLEGRTNTFWVHVQSGRPGQSVVLWLGYQLTGDRPLYWHLLAFALTLASGLAAYWMLRNIWPDQELLCVFVALVATIFPGFSSWAIPMMYAHWYAGMVFAFLSIGLTLRSGWWFTTAALLCALASWLTIEQFVALELVRYFVLWGRSHNPAGFAKRSAPFLLTLAGYLIWRVFFLSQTRATTNTKAIFRQYSSNPASELLALAGRMIKGTAESLASWFISPYEATTFPSSYRFSLLASVIIGLLTSLAFWLYARRREPPRSPRNVFPVGAIYVLGIVAIPALARFQTGISSFGDRFYLAASLGSALLICGLALKLIIPRYLIPLAAVFVGVCVATQLLTVNAYRVHWQRYREAWWQLSWRAPQIEKGTLVLVDDHEFFLPSERNGLWDEDVWGPLNAIYGDPKPTVDLAGQYLTPETRKALDQPELYVDPVDALAYSLKVDIRKRLVITLPKHGECLRVEGEERIVTDAPPRTPPVAIFGSEPEHGRCYEFQKAELARQRTQ